VLSRTPTSPAFNRPGVSPPPGRGGVVTAFYGNPRQLSAGFAVKF
jgi:hypothetical protein